MKTAIGNVAKTVKAPQGLSASALMTTRPRHREQNDHDRENAEHRDQPRDLAHSF